jgi:hypothetical protein
LAAAFFAIIDIASVIETGGLTDTRYYSYKFSCGYYYTVGAVTWQVYIEIAMRIIVTFIPMIIIVFERYRERL